MSKDRYDKKTGRCQIVYNKMLAKSHNILWFFFLDPPATLHYTFRDIHISKYRDMSLVGGEECQL